MRDLALELLEFVDDVVDELESREAVEYVHTVLREGTSADRQLGVLPRDRRSQGRRPAHRRRRRAPASTDVDGATSMSRCRTIRSAIGLAGRPRVQLSAGVHRAR